MACGGALADSCSLWHRLYLPCKLQIIFAQFCLWCAVTPDPVPSVALLLTLIIFASLSDSTSHHCVPRPICKLSDVLGGWSVSLIEPSDSPRHDARLLSNSSVDEKKGFPHRTSMIIINNERHKKCLRLQSAWKTMTRTEIARTALMSQHQSHSLGNANSNSVDARFDLHDALSKNDNRARNKYHNKLRSDFLPHPLLDSATTDEYGEELKTFKLPSTQAFVFGLSIQNSKCFGMSSAIVHPWHMTNLSSTFLRNWWCQFSSWAKNFGACCPSRTGQRSNDSRHQSSLVWCLTVGHGFVPRAQVEIGFHQIPSLSLLLALRQRWSCSFINTSSNTSCN